MLDIRLIRENAGLLDAAMKARGAAAVEAELLALDETRRAALSAIQELQAKRNALSKEIGMRKGKGEDASDLMVEMETVSPKMKMLEDAERVAVGAFEGALSALPNLPEPTIPVGKDETENQEIRRWGTPKDFSFSPVAHYDLGEQLGLLDFETSAKIAGARFFWEQGDLARLERALGNFMLDIQTDQNGFLEVIPPFMVNSESAFGTGQLPKFEEDLFRTTDGRWLIPTAEVPLTNYARDCIFPEDDLPKKFTALTPSFRSEAGSAGRDTRGLIRVHQFSKVEMVQIVHPEKSAKALDFMVGCAEDILQKLGLPYRVVLLCTGDMGFCSQRTYDLEVWIPSQNTYREISSCSNCGDFQARRMKARFKNKEGKIQFVHTLNGSGLAVGRTLVAVMENYQQADGSIAVPEVLQPYMGGRKVLRPLREMAPGALTRFAAGGAQ